MKSVTHALTMNGRTHGELKDPLDSSEDLILKRLTLLDGTRRYSLILWQIPEGVLFDRVNFRKWPQEYIQAAGSRDRMTVEVRRLEEGGYRHYVIGRSPTGNDGLAAMTTIVWDSIETRVLPTEVFTVTEAAELFVSYYATAHVPAEYVLRQLDL